MSRSFVLKSLQEQKNLRVSRKAASTQSKAACEGDCTAALGTQGACSPCSESPTAPSRDPGDGEEEHANRWPEGSVSPDFLKVPDFYFPQDTGEGFLPPLT